MLEQRLDNLQGYMGDHTAASSRIKREKSSRKIGDVLKFV
jgi:hypothetical protein